QVLACSRRRLRWSERSSEPLRADSAGRVKHSRAVYLVPKRHQGEVRERLTHPLAFLRLHDEHEEAAAASAAEFATFSTCLKGPRVMAVDIRGGNLESKPPLQHPAAVKSLAHLL